MHVASRREAPLPVQRKDRNDAAKQIPPLNQHRPQTREFAVGDRPCLPNIFTEDRTLLGCRRPIRLLLRPGRRLGQHHARFTFPIWNQAMTRVNVFAPRDPAALKRAIGFSADWRTGLRIVTCASDRGPFQLLGGET